MKSLYILLFITFVVWVLMEIKSPEYLCKEANGTLVEVPDGKICIKGLNKVNLKEFKNGNCKSHTP